MLPKRVRSRPSFCTGVEVWLDNTSKGAKMASSLEELLAEEGFQGKRGKAGRPKSFLGSRAVSMPLNLFQKQNHSGSSTTSGARTERTSSNVSRYSSRSGLLGSEKVEGRRQRDNLPGSKRIVERSKKDLKRNEMLEGRDSNGMQEIERFYARSSHDFSQNEIVEEQRGSDFEERERFKHIYLNEVQKSERGRESYSNGVGEKEKERYKERSRKDIQKYKRHDNSSDKILHGRMSFSDNSQKSLQRPESSYSKSSISSQKSMEDTRSRKHLEIEQTVVGPALDEVAIQAVISILSGYIGRFLKDNDFRASLQHNCSSSLGFSELEESHHTDITVIANLLQAMETVERVAEELANAKELKKASLQLSVITGLNSNDVKDGFTSGIPNSHLSACAHLYLGVLYKLQKKNKISAKHLLQVFCDSPFLARTSLLPELWEYLFLPHLSDLKVWYDQEAESIPDTSSRLRKLELLGKVYNEILDGGTYQFAVYYKDWLTEGVEAPAIPSIQIPSLSVNRVSKGSSHGHSPEQGSSPIGSVSPQMMISKKLYETVFSQSDKLDGTDEVNDGEGEEKFHNCSSSDVTTEEDKQVVMYSPEQGKHTRQQIEEAPIDSIQVVASYSADGLLMAAEEAKRLTRVRTPGVGELGAKAGISLWHTAPGRTHMEMQELPHTKANELTLKKLAKSIFQLQQNEDSIDLTANTPSHSTDMPLPHSSTNVRNIKCCVEGLTGIYEYFDEGSFFSSIPKDFICPLTGDMFEDPVTLETGQTFERAAIKEWFDQGRRTCPVTERELECLTVPVTNFVLKRVIDSWKSEHCKNLLAFASQITGSSAEHANKSKDETAVFILEHLLTSFNKEERMTNAKYLLSLGGLQFLIRRFELGNLEEKTRVVSLLFCCIEADGGCRHYLARNINKSCLLELLHCKQMKSRTNAVLLLTELICLNRRTKITSFLSGLMTEGIMNTMHVLLVYLQSCPAEQRPLVAVLLLHLDILVEPRKYSIYREEAVDTITVALDYCLTDEKVRAQCCRALLILGGLFSFSAEVLTENWLLREAGFYDGHEANFLDNVEELQVDETIPRAEEEEEEAREDWFKNLARSLLGNGKTSFLETISKCIGSGNLDLVRVCLTTVAWLSRALAAQSEAEFQLSAFSALIRRLKEILENGEQIEHRVLASVSLLNFTKISECRVLLMTIANEIVVPLRSLAEVTWTAKQLHTIISGKDI